MAKSQGKYILRILITGNQDRTHTRFFFSYKQDRKDTETDLPIIRMGKELT